MKFRPPGRLAASPRPAPRPPEGRHASAPPHAAPATPGWTRPTRPTTARDRPLSDLTFISPRGLESLRLAHMLDSLVRVSRRVRWVTETSYCRERPLAGPPRSDRRSDPRRCVLSPSSPGVPRGGWPELPNRRRPGRVRPAGRGRPTGERPTPANVRPFGIRPRRARGDRATAPGTSETGRGTPADLPSSTVAVPPV